MKFLNFKSTTYVKALSTYEDVGLRSKLKKTPTKCKKTT